MANFFGVTNSIEKLNNNNYGNWSTRMRYYLIGQDLWDIVGGDNTTPPTGDAKALKEWEIKCGKAMFVLMAAVEDDQMQRIKSAKTPKEAWDILKVAFAKKNEAKLQRLENELFSISQYNLTVSQYFAKVKSLCEEISKLDPDNEIKETRMRRIIIHGLRPEFKGLVTATRGWATQPTLDELENILSNEEALDEKMSKVALKDEDEALFVKKREYKNVVRDGDDDEEEKCNQRGRRKSRWRSSQQGGAKFGQRNDGRRDNDRCYKCNKRGHYARDCQSKRAEGNTATSTQNEQSEEEWDILSTYIQEEEEYSPSKQAVETTKRPEHEPSLISLSEGINYDNDWIVDSGCSNHMTGDKEKLSNVSNYNGGRVVVTANNTRLPIAHIGKATIVPRSSEEEMELQKVYHVPGVKKNLLSVSQLTSAGSYVVFGPDDVKVYRNIKLIGDPIMEGRRVESIYVMSAQEAYVDKTRKSETADLWHARLGHVSYHKLKVMMKKSMLKGLPNMECREDTICAGCQYGKAHQLPYEESKYRAKAPLELIHSDVLGRINQPTNGNMRYMITFIDDYSRYVWIDFMIEKSQALEKFKAFKEKVEKELGESIKCLRTDNGGEYTSGEFTNFCQEQGIRRQFTCPRTPQQNGVAERKNRHLVEICRSMLHAKNVPARFWGECMKTVAYVINRLPQPKLEFMSPFQKLWNIKPTVSHFRVFGCVCYVFIQDELRSKFDKKALRCIFVGYDEQRKGWRCCDPTTNRCHVSRNVIFDEASSWWSPQATLLPDSKEIQENVGKKMGDGESTPEKDQTEQSRNQEKLKSPWKTGAYERRPANEGEEDPDYPPLRRSGRERRPNPKYVNAAIIAEIKEPTTYEEASKEKEWTTAMEEEIAALEQNQTWELVPKPREVKPISCKWVYKIKTRPDGSIERCKARLVARGFSQQYGLDYDETFSPVAKITTVRVLLALAASKSWLLWQMDVKNAFLHGEVDREIYMEQPPGFRSREKPNYVCKLRKALYGLKQAPRAWYGKIAEFLVKNGYAMAPADSSLFVKDRDGRLAIVLVYVDDLIITGDNIHEIQLIRENLATRFKMKELGKLKHFLGLEIEETKKGMFLGQQKYARDLLKRFGMMDCKPISTPIDANVKVCAHEGKDLEDATMFRQLVGSLIYLTMTRPDISFAVGIVSRFMQKPKKPHLEAARRILRYIKSTIDYGIIYKKDGSPKIEGYCDADYAGDHDTRRSTTGYAFSLSSGAISWCSKRQPTVSLSTTEAEYRAAATAAQEGVWLSQLMEDLHQPIDYPIPLNCDSHSAIQLAENPVFHARTKHVEVHYHFIREKVLQGDIQMKYIKTEDQPADIFTKGFSRSKFEDFRQQLGMTEKEKVGVLKIISTDLISLEESRTIF